MSDVLPQTNFRERGYKLCIDHLNEELQFVCKDCNEALVCSTCISTTHSGHKFVAIRLIVQKKINRLQDLNTAIQDTRIPKIQKNIENVEEAVKETQNGIGVLKRKAIDRGNYLKDLIDISTTETVSILEDMEHKITKEFEQFKHDSETNIKHLEELLEESRQVTRSNDNILIVDLEKHLSSTVIDKAKYEFRSPEFEFHEGSDAEFHIKAANATVTIEEHRNPDSTGNERRTLVRSDSQHQARRQETELLESDQSNQKFLKKFDIAQLTDLNFIPRTMMRTSQGEVLMCDNETSNIYSIDHSNSVIFTLDVDRVHDISTHPLSTDFYCLASSSSSRCFGLLNSYEYGVKTVNRNGKTSKLFNIQEEPFCMAVIGSGKILIGACGKPVVKLYTDIGTVIQTIKTVSDVSHISVCRTSGYLAFSCFDSGVMVMDERFKHLYTCKPSDYHSGGWDADFDDAGHLLIASFRNKTIYLVDSTTGDVLKHIHVDTGFPYCLSTQCDGIILVGTFRPKRILKMNYLE